MKFRDVSNEGMASMQWGLNLRVSLNSLKESIVDKINEAIAQSEAAVPQKISNLPTEIDIIISDVIDSVPYIPEDDPDNLTLAGVDIMDDSVPGLKKQNTYLRQVIIDGRHRMHGMSVEFDALKGKMQRRGKVIQYIQEVLYRELVLLKEQLLKARATGAHDYNDHYTDFTLLNAMKVVRELGEDAKAMGMTENVIDGETNQAIMLNRKAEIVIRQLDSLKSEFDKEKQLMKQQYELEQVKRESEMVRKLDELTGTLKRSSDLEKEAILVKHEKEKEEMLNSITELKEEFETTLVDERTRIRLEADHDISTMQDEVQSLKTQMQRQKEKFRQQLVMHDMRRDNDRQSEAKLRQGAEKRQLEVDHLVKNETQKISQQLDEAKRLQKKAETELLHKQKEVDKLTCSLGEVEGQNNELQGELNNEKDEGRKVRRELMELTDRFYQVKGRLDSILNATTNYEHAKGHSEANHEALIVNHTSLLERVGKLEAELEAGRDILQKTILMNEEKCEGLKSTIQKEVAAKEKWVTDYNTLHGRYELLFRSIREKGQAIDTLDYSAELLPKGKRSSASRDPVSPLHSNSKEVERLQRQITELNAVINTQSDQMREMKSGADYNRVLERVEGLMLHIDNRVDNSIFGGNEPDTLVVQGSAQSGSLDQKHGDLQHQAVEVVDDWTQTAFEQQETDYLSNLQMFPFPFRKNSSTQYSDIATSARPSIAVSHSIDVPAVHELHGEESPDEDDSLQPEMSQSDYKQEREVESESAPSLTPKGSSGSIAAPTGPPGGGVSITFNRVPSLSHPKTDLTFGSKELTFNISETLDYEDDYIREDGTSTKEAPLAGTPAQTVPGKAESNRPKGGLRIMRRVIERKAAPVPINTVLPFSTREGLYTKPEFRPINIQHRVISMQVSDAMAHMMERLRLMFRTTTNLQEAKKRWGEIEYDIRELDVFERLEARAYLLLEKLNFQRALNIQIAKQEMLDIAVLATRPPVVSAIAQPTSIVPPSNTPCPMPHVEAEMYTQPTIVQSTPARPTSASTVKSSSAMHSAPHSSMTSPAVSRPQSASHTQPSSIAVHAPAFSQLTAVANRLKDIKSDSSDDDQMANCNTGIDVDDASNDGGEFVVVSWPSAMRPLSANVSREPKRRLKRRTRPNSASATGRSNLSIESSRSKASIGSSHSQRTIDTTLDSTRTRNGYGTCSSASSVNTSVGAPSPEPQPTSRVSSRLYQPPDNSKPSEKLAKILGITTAFLDPPPVRQYGVFPADSREVVGLQKKAVHPIAKAMLVHQHEEKEVRTAEHDTPHTLRVSMKRMKPLAGASTNTL